MTRRTWLAAVIALSACNTTSGITPQPNPSPLCTATGPVVLTARQGTISSIALDDASVYFTATASGAVGKVAKAGGVVAVIAATENAPDSLAVDGTNVYWTIGDHKTLRAVSRGGGAAFDLVVSPTEYSGAIATDSASVYWGGGALMKVDADGQHLAHLADLPEGPRWLRVHGGEVFYLTNYMLYRAPADGGAATQLGDTNYMFGLDVDDSGLYYAITRTISEMPLAGGQATPLLADTTGVTDGIAVDERFVYWTSSGSVLRVDKTGGALVTLATAQNQPRSVLVDADSLYWINAGDDSIVRLCK
jgi:streptogramin lyase